MELMLINLELLLRVVVAALCGIVIGYERMNHHKAAGVKTHMIVCMSASLMMIASKYAFFDVRSYDASRIASQVVSGISFLGAGIIFKKNYNIQGLTTAAGIWAISGVGLILGAGMYYLGICATVLFVLFQISIQKIEKFQPMLIKDYVVLINKDALLEYLNFARKNEVVAMDFQNTKQDLIELKINLIFQNKHLEIEWEDFVLKNKNTISFTIK